MCPIQHGSCCDGAAWVYARILLASSAYEPFEKCFQNTPQTKMKNKLECLPDGDTRPGHRDTRPGHRDTRPGHRDTRPGHWDTDGTADLAGAGANSARHQSPLAKAIGENLAQGGAHPPSLLSSLAPWAGFFSFCFGFRISQNVFSIRSLGLARVWSEPPSGRPKSYMMS